MRSTLEHDDDIEELSRVLNNKIIQVTNEIDFLGKMYCTSMENFFQKIQLTVPKNQKNVKDIYYFDVLQKQLWQAAQQLRNDHKQSKKNQDHPLYLLGTRIVLTLASQRRRLKKKITSLTKLEKKLDDLFTTHNLQKRIG